MTAHVFWNGRALECSQCGREFRADPSGRIEAATHLVRVHDVHFGDDRDRWSGHGRISA
jgi:hypothetical protein